MMMTMMTMMPLVIARQNEEEEEEKKKYRRRVVEPEVLPCFVLMCLGTGDSSLKEGPRALHPLHRKNWLSIFFKCIHRHLYPL
jgi:hypothetical protein